jgi:dTMP kinase
LFPPAALCFVLRVQTPAASSTRARGLLVAVEGIDGAGKSTALRALAAFCEERGVAFVTSREPTNGPAGRALRESATHGRLSLEEELELFCRDRAEHVEQVIRPALAAGKIVLLDRYYLSTAAYQGARGADPAAIIARNEEFAPRPDLVLLLDVDPGSGLGRVRRRGDVPDAFEREDALREVRRIFLSLDWPQIVRIEAGQGPEAVAGECTGALAAALAGRDNRTIGQSDNQRSDG